MYLNHGSILARTKAKIDRKVKEIKSKRRQRELTEFKVRMPEARARPKRSDSVHKTVITISSPLFSKSLELGKITKRAVVFSAIFLIFFFFAGSLAIAYGTTTVQTLQDSLDKFKADYIVTQSENDQLKASLNESKEERQRVAELEKMVTLKSDTPNEGSSMSVSDIPMKQRVMLLRNIPNGYPVNSTTVSSGFAERVNPVSGKHEFHPALDIICSIGTKVHATADGIVEYAGVAPPEKWGYGNMLVISHSYGFKTAFGHLSGFKVKSGDFVKKGQVVAYSGSTGQSSGPHVHYEVRFMNAHLNPDNFVKWNVKNFALIFQNERNVKWASLVEATRWTEAQHLTHRSSQTEQKLLASLQ